MLMVSRKILVVWVAVLGIANSAYAQSATAPTPTPRPEAATVEKIMEQAVRNISMRYNLNKEQTDKTRKIMQREVHRFLREHENEVWPLIRDLLASQLGGKPPDDMNEVKRIGRSARPLVQLAKDAIFRGNEEWRKFLTSDQQRMHDHDLAQMDQTFQTIEKRFDQWAEGMPSGRLFPGPPEVDHSPPRPPKPDPGLPKPRTEIIDPYRIFSVYVEEFIKKYDLSEGQIDSARSILEEFRAKAIDFKMHNRQSLLKIENDYTAAQKAGDRKKLSQVEIQRKKLLKPIYELFAQMDRRLTALLTTAQRQRFASADQPTAKQTAGTNDDEVKTKKRGSEPEEKPVDNDEGD